MIIYKVTNKKSGNVYIGQTVKSLEERKHNHFLSSLSKNSKSKFHKAIKSYGIDNFNWEETKKLISKRTKEAMVKLDKDELIRKALIGRKKYWDNKHQSDRDLILQLKSKGYSVKKIQSELDISTPTYYKRLNELKKLGLIK